MTPLVSYLLGATTGAAVVWYVAVMRQQLGPSTHALARDAVSGHVFKRAVSDVVDTETGEAITERTNELYDEYDLPGDPQMNYVPDREVRE